MVLYTANILLPPHSVNISEIRCKYISDAEISDAGISDADDNDAGTTDANDSDAGDSTGDKDQLGSGDVDGDDTTVCGTDGKTYPSVCHLLQNTVNEHVLHAGRCNASQCSGGPVRLITIHGITNHSFVPRLLRNSKLQCSLPLNQMILVSNNCSLGEACISLSNFGKSNLILSMLQDTLCTL